MSPQPPVSSTEITKQAGIPRDVLTFWLRNGLLRPIEAAGGKGKHLRFQWYETNIASIMNQLRILGVKIEGMLSIARIYREAIAYFDALGIDADQAWAIWSYLNLQKIFVHEYVARKRMLRIVNAPDFDPEKFKSLAKVAEFTDEDEENYWMEQFKELGADKHGPRRLTQELHELADQIDHDKFFRHHGTWETITARPKPEEPVYANTDELTYFWRVGDGEEYRMAWGGEAAKAARKDGAFSMIAVDVFAVIHHAWNGPTTPIVDEDDAGDEGASE